MNLPALFCGFAAALSLGLPAPAASLAYTIVPRQSLPDSCGWAVLSGLLGRLQAADADDGCATDAGAGGVVESASGSVTETALLGRYRDGSIIEPLSLAEMGRILLDCGIVSIPLLADMDAIVAIMQDNRPAVLHLDAADDADDSRGHYVLGIGARNGLATIADPASGVRSMPFRTLAARWSGIALLPLFPPPDAGNSAIPPGGSLRDDALRSERRYRFLEGIAGGSLAGASGGALVGKTAACGIRAAPAGARPPDFAVCADIGSGGTQDGAAPLYAFTIHAGTEFPGNMFFQGRAGIELSKAAGPGPAIALAFSIGARTGFARDDPARDMRFAALGGLSLRGIGPRSGQRQDSLADSVDASAPRGSGTGAARLFDIVGEFGAAAAWLSDPLSFGLEARAEASIPVFTPESSPGGGCTTGKTLALSASESVLCAVTGNFAFDAALRQEISIRFEPGARVSFAAGMEAGAWIATGKSFVRIGAGIGILSFGKNPGGGRLRAALSTRL